MINIIEMNNNELKDMFLNFSNTNIFYGLAVLHDIVTKPEKMESTKSTTQRQTKLDREHIIQNRYFAIPYNILQVIYGKLVEKEINIFDTITTEWWDYDNFVENINQLELLGKIGPHGRIRSRFIYDDTDVK